MKNCFFGSRTVGVVGLHGVRLEHGNGDVESAAAGAQNLLFAGAEPRHFVGASIICPDFDSEGSRSDAYGTQKTKEQRVCLHFENEIIDRFLSKEGFKDSVKRKETLVPARCAMYDE